MSGKKSRLDALVGLSDVDTSSGSEDETDKEAAPKDTGTDAAPAAKKAKNNIDIDTLRRHGLQEGPSVLFVPEKRDGDSNWAWGAGTDRQRDEEETFEEREANRAAVHEGAEDAAQFALRAQQQAAALREQKRVEQEKLRQEKKLSWNQKEKRKRDEGKATRGKNYVEEEKRRLRQAGVYSGFD